MELARSLLARGLLELGCPKSLESLFKPSQIPWSHSLRRGYPTSAATAASTSTNPIPAAPTTDNDASDHHSQVNGRQHEVAAKETVSPSTPHNPGTVVLKEGKWTKVARRTGLIAIKLGMTQLWNKEGRPIAVTVLQVPNLSLPLSLFPAI